MVDQYLRVLDRTGVYLLCLIIPGILFIANGIHVIRTKQTISLERDPGYHWKKPILIMGERAIRDGRCGLIFGAGLLILGLIIVFGILQ